jgi:hypothetical protein
MDLKNPYCTNRMDEIIPQMPVKPQQQNLILAAIFDK